MNKQRLVVLGLAAVAAAGAAFLARGLLGGGTQHVAAAPASLVPMTEVLVAASDLQPGTKLTAAAVRWQNWPKSAVNASFITQDANPDLSKVVAGEVVRAPLLSGQPVTDTSIVRSDAAGFMAATLTPGMRAVSIGITTESGAGGFILPNDRVDVIQTQQTGEGRNYRSQVILHDIRVLAVDQTYKEDTNQKVVLAKTATLELSPGEAAAVVRAQAGGTLSLALRSLASENPNSPDTALKAERGDGGSGEVSIIRYGVARAETSGQKE